MVGMVKNKESIFNPNLPKNWVKRKIRKAEKEENLEWRKYKRR